jgi:hypothetical protein
VVTGICTGGFYGVHGASAGAGMDAVIAINPQLWCSETSSINVTPDVDVFAARRSAVAARDVNKWMRLLRGGYRLSDVVQALRGTMKRVAGSLNGGADGESTLGGGLPRLDLVALFPPDVPMHLVFSEDDFGYEHLLAHGQARLEKLFEQPHLHLHRIAGVDHTFSREWMRKVLDEEVLELLAKL